MKADWQTHVLASSGYLELGMFDDAALVLEEIAPEDRTRNEILGTATQIEIMSGREMLSLSGAKARTIERSSSGVIHFLNNQSERLPKKSSPKVVETN